MVGVGLGWKHREPGVGDVVEAVIASTDEHEMPGDRRLVDQQRPGRCEVLRHQLVAGRQTGVE
ncbi:hypothetical protein EAO72_08180 [Streptomyces sp. or43]|nr:hypothetical protein EAO72_08180 [Streptomyces sp. or43]